MFNATLYKTINYYWLRFCQYAELNTVIVLCTLPIVVGWGLPTSAMTILGNLLFTPVLSLFLLISAFIFISEILHIPNQWLITLLEYITNWWHTLLQYNSPSWLLGISYTLWPATLIVAGIVFYIYHRRHLPAYKRQLILASLFLGLCTLQWAYLKVQKHTSIITYKRSKMFVFRYKGKTTLFDIGLCKRLLYPEKWIEYHLKQHLFLSIGSHQVDTFIALNPTEKTDYFESCLQKQGLLV